MTEQERVYVAGHHGLVGSAIARRLRADGIDPIVRSRDELDLREASAVDDLFREERPTQVFLAAARVGGIAANIEYPAEFARDNLLIEANVIHSAYRHDTRKLLFLGSSCIYPRDCPQPIREDYLLTGSLEPTNRSYAISKIMGIELCAAYRSQYGCDFVSAMPTNLYGPGDNYHPLHSHVIPGLIGRFHEARVDGRESVVVWGSGTPRREFLHVDDLADACMILMERYSDPMPINVGRGEDVSIAELASLVADVVGFEGSIVFDRSRPDGTPRKVLDTARIDALGWRPRIALREGLTKTYESFRRDVSDRFAGGTLAQP